MEVNQNWITSNRHVLPEKLTVSFSTESAQNYTKFLQNIKKKMSRQKYVYIVNKILTNCITMNNRSSRSVSKFPGKIGCNVYITSIVCVLLMLHKTFMTYFRKKYLIIFMDHSSSLWKNKCCANKCKDMKIGILDQHEKAPYRNRLKYFFFHSWCKENVFVFHTLGMIEFFFLNLKSYHSVLCS